MEKGSTSKIIKEQDERIYNFLNFPSLERMEKCGEKTFGQRVRRFLKTIAVQPFFGEHTTPLVTWQVPLHFGDATMHYGTRSLVLYLDIMEEDVEKSESIYCDMCKIAGWSKHPICVKRYNFIIQADGKFMGDYKKSCLACEESLPVLQTRCNTCNQVAFVEKIKHLMRRKMQRSDHLLHGVVHENGYGHLLRLNGREGGSKVLCGSNLMDLWDRICTALGVRKVTLMDFSEKYGLEYRLLHGVIKGQSWYGNWGYELGHLSYGISHGEYYYAIRFISYQPLNMLFSSNRNQMTRLGRIILLYKSLSDRVIVTVKDLFDYLVNLIKSTVEDSKELYSLLCEKRRTWFMMAWSRDQIEMAEESLIRILLTQQSNWVSSRCLEKTCYDRGPSNLLNYCIEELEGKHLGDRKVVTSRFNPQIGQLEYRVVTLGDPSMENPTLGVSSKPSDVQLLTDLIYLYDALLNPSTMHDFMPSEMKTCMSREAMKVLDCKQLIKNFELGHSSIAVNTSKIWLSCQLELVAYSGQHTTKPPPQQVSLPPNATVLDLKVHAEKAFRDVYISFKKLKVVKVLYIGHPDDDTPILPLLNSHDCVSVLGILHEKSGILNEFMMEGGTVPWVVDCECGAKDDDGEMMLACDFCDVWKHTRCSGFQEYDELPNIFMCGKCNSPNKGLKLESKFTKKAHGHVFN